MINCIISGSREHRLKRPLTTNELLKETLLSKKFDYDTDADKIKINQKEFNVKVSEEGLYQCFGRIHGEHPILSPKSKF